MNPHYAISPAMRLTIVRAKLGISQQELADKADLARNTISNAENGKRIELDTLMAISHALGTAPHVWLLPDIEWVKWLAKWMGIDDKQVNE